MSSENRFVYNPSSLDIGRSKFLMNSFWKGSIYHGDLVPVEITRVMPGDSAKYDISAFIRTATPPIAPFMDTIRLSFAAFYVPERLVWAKEKEFLGENTEGYGIQSEILAPRSTHGGMTVAFDKAATDYKRSIGTYLGLVRQTANATTISKPSPIGLNPLRCFLQVWNDWFRNENFMAPYLWNHSEVGDASRALATRGGNNVNATTSLPRVCKQLDRYTSCLPWAQKGSPVILGIGDVAPIVAADSFHSTSNPVAFSSSTGIDPELDGTYTNNLDIRGNGNVLIPKESWVQDYDSEDYLHVDKTNLVEEPAA